jgi:hypothetical protein
MASYGLMKAATHYLVKSLAGLALGGDAAAVGSVRVHEHCALVLGSTQLATAAALLFCSLRTTPVFLIPPVYLEYCLA